MNKHTKLIFIFLLFCASSFAQDSLFAKIQKTKYYHYLRYADSTSQNHLLIINYQFMVNPVGKTFGAQGLIPTFGFNIARLFSKKIIIAACLDFKAFPGFATKKLSSQFVSDFNKNYTQTYHTPLDSANTYTVKEGINSNSIISGNDVFNIGIMISLFPQRYGGILLQVKHGEDDFEFHSVLNNKYVDGGGRDKFPMGISDNWTYELTLKPYAFFSNSYISFTSGSDDIIWKSICVSFFYERLNFKSAEFNGTPLSTMVKPEFMNKYGIDNRFGFKIGFAFY
ncbi:MAG: hypothetical protein JWP12_715 [Bacteroidetes bacterium]|nr:hypothetical protein [Bacteroidota bacterium]